MASSASPRTPGTTPRRSVTAPITGAFTPSKPPPEIGSAKGIEITYTHPNARIFKFRAAASSLSFAHPPRSQSSSGTLPWASATETTMAVGPFEIYFVPGSVCFLRAGSLLQALLPKSQCWCVDGVSKFVIRGPIDTYYRIEVPGETAEDLEEVEKLKNTLQKMIYYEKTPCPFARTFTVDLPDEQLQEPRKKRRRNTEGRAKKWKHDHAFGWRPEGWQPGMAGPDEHEDESASASSSGSGSESSGKEGTDESSQLRENMAKVNVAQSPRSGAMQALRSASMSQQSTTPRTPPSRPRPREDRTRAEEDDDSTVGAERIHQTTPIRTFQAMPTVMPPSPPDSSAGVDSSDVRIPAEGWVEIETTVEVPRHHANDLVPADEDTTSENEQRESVNDESLDEEVSNVEGQVAQVDTDLTNTDHTLEESNIDRQVVASPKSVRISDNHPSAHVITPTEQGHGENAPGGISSEDQSPPGEYRPMTPPAKQRSNSDDPYAAIQARILARRSLSGTTLFHPLHKSPTRGSSSSTSSAATIVSNRSALSHRSRRQNEDLATTVVKRVYTVFLGPPAHLVTLMLKIAARFASGTFGVNGVLHVESPAGSPRRPPGSFHLHTDGENVEAVELDDDDDEDEDGWEDDEDDFGVKLNHPVSGMATGLRERRLRDVD